MKDKLSVLVGTGIGGQREIISALSDAGFNTQSAGCRMWPRNHYVHLMDRYVKNGSVMSINGNPFGDGGHILTGNDFLLVSFNLSDDGIQSDSFWIQKKYLARST